MRDGSICRSRMVRSLAACSLLLISAASGAQAEAPAQAPAKKDPELEKFEKALEGFERIPGWLGLHRKEDRLLLELRPADFGPLFLAQATLHTGISADAQAGDPLGEYEPEVLRWERRGESIRLVAPNLAFRFSPTGALALAHERSFPRAILASFRPAAKNPETDAVLIDPAPLFDGQLFGLAQLMNETAGAGWQPDRSVEDITAASGDDSVLALRKAFHFRRPAAGGPSLGELLGLSAPLHLADRRSLPIEVSFKLWPRLESGYVPRLADPRVGYFSTDFFDLDRFGDFGRTTRLINRFHLIKKDPRAALSEPVQPIVWHLDPTIPAEHREAVRQGILLWNRAFEEAGFKNALVVRDAPEDPSYDHASGRWNVVRWTTSPDSAYAVAQMRMDPISGEIHSASVTVDAGYPRAFGLEFDEDVSASAAGALLRVPAEAARPHRHAGRDCRMSHGWKSQAAYGLALLEASGREEQKDAYLKAGIVDLVAHEIGHCLGLRHNFAASGHLSNAELADPARTAIEGIAASVMDYTPVNTAALLAGRGDYWNPLVGRYDRWAIRYGYSDLPGTTTQGERPGLEQIARQSGLPGLAFLTDEDANGLNPLAATWDLGSDPLAWIALEQAAAARLQAHALRDGARQGESFERRTAMLERSLRSRFRAARFAARMVGGIEYRRMLRGDVGEEPTLRPVASAQQRQAMSLIAGSVLRPDALTLPVDALNRFTGDPYKGGASDYAPLQARMVRDQTALLSQLMSAGRYDQIIENSVKEPGGYTLAEHLDRLDDAIFGDLQPSARLAPHRRELQAFMAEGLALQSKAASGAISRDGRLLARRKLEQLLPRAEAAAKTADLPTRLHAEDLARQIAAALEEGDE